MRQNIEYALYRIGSALFGLLPEPAVRSIGTRLGWAGSFLSKQKFALVQKNLARVVGPDQATRSRTRRMFASYGRYWAEVFWVRASNIDAIHRHGEVIGAHHITAAVEQGKGVILALPHLGNWEMAGPAAEELGGQVLAVAEALPNQKIVDWFLKTRGDLGIDVVLAGQDRGVTQQLLKQLKSGGLIALMSDRDLTGKGIEVDFFGERTTLPAGPAALADRTGAALIPVGCYFKSGRGHRFEVRPPIEVPDIADKTTRIQHMTQLFANALEDLISVDPEQWHLFQPNWPSDSA